MALAVIAPLLTALLIVVVILRRARRLPLPPGPPQWPIIGNLLDMPTIRPWVKYREWCSTYSMYNILAFRS